MNCNHKNKKFLFLISFLIFISLSFNVIAADVSLTGADTTIYDSIGGDLVDTFLPALGSNLMPETDYYYGVHGESSSVEIIEGVQVKITVVGPASLEADMVHIDERGWYDQVDFSVNVFHYPFVAQEDGTLVATGSCADADDHVCAGGTDAWEVEPDDEFFNVDRISFASNAPSGIYTIIRQLIGPSEVSDEFILTTLLDNQAPVTTKTYGDPNEEGQIKVPSCWEGGDVIVNDHVITTATTINLEADDGEGSGVYGTSYAILIPAECGFGDEVEYVGLDDNNLYQNFEECGIAIDNPETEEIETQACVETWWTLDSEQIYEGSFMVGEESIHKICFFSTDNAGNEEELRCQVAVVDDSAPEVSVGIDHDMIDTEYYSGNSGSFDDPKCSEFSINATDTHGIESVHVMVDGVIQDLVYPQVTGLEGFNEESWDSYISEGIHSMAEATLNEESGSYIYKFCPGEHLYHLYDNEVISWDGLKNLVSEGLNLGTFEFPVIATDGVGKETEVLVSLDIVDLTVPLETGWNLRSTPIKLDGNIFWSNENIDAVLRWDSPMQAWELVTDNSIAPLESLYIHATDRNQIGMIFERSLTPPPADTLNVGWNLVGTTNLLWDSLQNPCQEEWDWHDSEHYGYVYYGDQIYHWGYHWTPEDSEHDLEHEGYVYDDWIWHSGYHYGSAETCEQELTYLWDDYTYIGEAFGSLIYNANGNRALETVISPYQYLSYETDEGSWYFNQNHFVWAPQIQETGADPENYWDESVYNFGGYWVFMQNSDMLPGFTTTPLPLDGGD